MISAKVFLHFMATLAVLQFISAGINHLSFERHQCFPNSNTGSTVTKCVMKAIDRDHVRVDGEVTVNRTIKEISAQYDLHFQISTNEFKKFVNVVEDFCEYIKGNVGNILLSRIYPDFLPFTNVNHTCPYAPGKYFVRIANLSISSLAPSILVPSGRWRLDVTAREGFKGPILAKGRFYGSISDHRVEKF